MKKLLTLLLASVMAVSFTACSESDAVLDDEKDEVEENVEKDEATDDEQVDEQVEEQDETDDNAPSEDAGDIEAVLEETVLVDEDGLKIVAKSLEYDEFWGMEEINLKLYIENNSDEDLTIGTDVIYVNGYYNSGWFMAEVAAGKKANEDVTLSTDDLETCKITTITDIDLMLRAYNDDFEDVYESTLITVKTSAAGKYTQTYDDSGDVLLDENGIKVVSKGIVTDDIWGTWLLVYIHNGTDKTVTVSADDISVNGFMTSGWLYDDVLGGKHCVTAVSFLDEDFEDNNIETIEEIEMQVIVEDAQTWDIVAEGEPVTIIIK